MKLRNFLQGVLVLSILNIGVVGCSGKSGEDQILSVADDIAEEFIDKGETKYMAIEAGKTIIYQLAGTIFDGINNKKCNVSEIRKVGNLLNNNKLDFDWGDTMADIANQLCEDDKISKASEDLYIKSIINKFENQYN